MAYQLTLSDMVLRLADGAFIPPDPGNRDYAEYLVWLDEGNTPEPAAVTDPVPEPSPEEKLAASGLTIDELKQLLGL